MLCPIGAVIGTTQLRRHPDYLRKLLEDHADLFSSELASSKKKSTGMVVHSRIFPSSHAGMNSPPNEWHQAQREHQGREATQITIVDDRTLAPAQRGIVA